MLSFIKTAGYSFKLNIFLPKIWMLKLSTPLNEETFFRKGSKFCDNPVSPRNKLHAMYGLPTQSSTQMSLRRSLVIITTVRMHKTNLQSLYIQFTVQVKCGTMLQ